MGEPDVGLLQCSVITGIVRELGEVSQAAMDVLAFDVDAGKPCPLAALRHLPEADVSALGNSHPVRIAPKYELRAGVYTVYSFGHLGLLLVAGLQPGMKST